MPNKHAAIKDLRKNKKRAKKNARIKTHAKALIKQLEALIKENKKAEAKALVSKIQQVAAKAAKTHVFHRNKSVHLMSKAQKAVARMK